MYWFRKAADLSNKKAQFALGRAYANGRGVPQDDSQACGWYKMAGDQGSVEV